MKFIFWMRGKGIEEIGFPVVEAKTVFSALDKLDAVKIYQKFLKLSAKDHLMEGDVYLAFVCKHNNSFHSGFFTMDTFRPTFFEAPPDFDVFEDYYKLVEKGFVEDLKVPRVEKDCTPNGGILNG